jgi:hypothetical protein
MAGGGERIPMGQDTSSEYMNLGVEAASDPNDSINVMIKERGKRYGIFRNHARITQDFKEIMQNEVKWKMLYPDQKESLEMIAHKIGRILNGDPDYIDSWDDIAGYAKLVADRLRGNEK